MPGIGKYMLSFRTQNFRGWKPLFFAWSLRVSQDQWHFRLHFASKAWERRPKSSFLATLIQQDWWLICAGLTLIVLLHKEGSTYGESYAKRRALGGPWGLHPLLPRCFVPGTSPASLLSHSADSWGVPEAIKLRFFHSQVVSDWRTPNRVLHLDHHEF